MEIELSALAREKVNSHDPFPSYVHRGPEDDRIRSRLKQHRFVIVAGNRYAGKTRAALEAIRSGRDGKVMLVRRAAPGENPLRELLSAPWLVPKRSRCFVFVDKIDAYLEGLDPHEIRDWLDARPKAALVATISLTQKRAAFDPDHESFDENRQILHEDRVALLKDKIGGKALAEAKEEYGEDPELERIGSYLGGGDVVERRFAEAESEHPTVWAIVTAAVCAARAGMTGGLTETSLVELAKSLGLLGRFDPDIDVEAALEYCCHEPEGMLGMLSAEERPGAGRRLRANTILVRAAEATGPMPLETWEKVAEVLAEDQSSCVRIAKAAWLQAIAEDPPDRALMEIALEALWSDEAELGQDPDQGRIAVDLAAALIEELELPEGAPRVGRQPFGPPAPLPPPDREKVDEAIDRREVTGADDLFVPALPAYWNPPRFYSNRGKRNVLRFALLFAMDLVSACAGVAVGAIVANQLLSDTEAASTIVRGARIGIPLLIVLFMYLGLYRPDSERAKVPEIVKGMTIVAFVVALVALVAGFKPSILLLVLFCGIGASFAVWLARALYDWGSVKWVGHRQLRARTLFVAPAHSAYLSADLVRQTSRRPMQFVGFVSREETTDSSQLSTLREFEQVLDDFYVDHVIVADPELPSRKRSELATTCHLKGVRLELFPSSDEIFQDAGGALTDLSVPLIPIPPPYLPRFSARIKRYLDLIGAVLFVIPGLILLVPLTIVLLVLNLGRWPVEKVPRLGRKTVAFSMYRFRLQAEHPLTGFFNALLERLHLDELPQLFNVLKGDMSLVGPRPLDDREFSQLKEVERHRYAVKPGMTGLWQINRRNRPVRDEFARISLMATLDLVYCRRWSPLLDFTIVLRTPWAMLRPSK